MSLEKILSKYQYYVAHEVPPVKRLRSGILAFDIVTGGGIPIGRFVEFHGDKSTGKSTLALKITNNFLETDSRKAVYIDFENTFDPKWSSYFVKDTNRLLVTHPEYGELGVDLLVELFKNPDEVGFIIVDSLATIIPTKEADSDAMSMQVASQARLVSSMFRKLLPFVAKNNKSGKHITTILINQIRMKIDGYGRPNQIVKPAGKMQDAIVSMDIRFYAKDYKIINGVPVMLTYQINVEKNKVGGHPKRSAQFDICLVPHNGFNIGDCDDINTYIQFMKKLNIMKKEGNKWQIAEKEFKNLAEVTQYLKANPKAKDKIAQYIIELLDENISSLLAGEEDEI